MDTLPAGQSSKSPAFSFYAKEWLAATLSWALDARGAYATLMAYQWDAGSVPGDDLKALARVLGVSSAKARLVWSVVSSKFQRGDDGQWRNTRLEQEREKQKTRREALQANGARGGRPPKNQNETNRFSQTEPNEKLNKSLSSSSSSSITSSGVPSKNDGTTPPPLIRGEASPKGWGKIHGEHVTGFCDWVCLPEFLFAEFTRKSGASFHAGDGGVAYVNGWAHRVRTAYEGQPVGDNLKFWRSRWAESHPEKVNGAKSVTDEIDEWARS